MSNMKSAPLGEKKHRTRDIVVLQAGRIFHSKRQHGYYEGELTKRGGSLIDSWKLRHFRLKGTTLSYYDNDKSEHSKGEVHFHNMTVLQHIKSNAMPFMFSISGWRNGSPRVLELSAKSETERAFWMEALDAALHEGYAKFDYPEYWFKAFYPRADISMWLAPKVQLETGGMLLPRDCRTPPSITHCCGESDSPAFSFFICDFAFPTFDKMDSKVFVHWALCNVPNHGFARTRNRSQTRVTHLGNTAHPDKDEVPHPLPEFLPQMWTKNSINNEGTEILSFFPPAPPYETGVHRYVLLLFKQETVLDVEEVGQLRASLGLEEARILPNLHAFFQVLTLTLTLPLPVLSAPALSSQTVTFTGVCLVLSAPALSSQTVTCTGVLFFMHLHAQNITARPIYALFPQLAYHCKVAGNPVAVDEFRSEYDSSVDGLHRAVRYQPPPHFSSPEQQQGDEYR